MPTVTTNTAANTALRFLNFNATQSGSSIAKLASGSRIVKASDDAAGLAIGTRLRADVTVLRQSAVDASQGASVLQVADGGLARIADVHRRADLLGHPLIERLSHGANVHACVRRWRRRQMGGLRPAR